MTNISMFIDLAGKGVAPADWHQARSINIQRLYYIKSGTGYYIGEDGTRTRFIPGRIYLHPYNLRHRFITCADDRIDHLFFDFLSTPPIISPEPLCYDVRPATPLMHMVELLDSLLRERRTGMRALEKYSYTAGAGAGSHEEYGQTIYTLLQALLMLLSNERELPFASDPMVIDTLEYIRENYAAPISVGELAARAGFEVNYFIRRFGKVMGLTPYAYLRSYRLLRAGELISGGVTIARAAELVGYENASSLSRALKCVRKSQS